MITLTEHEFHAAWVALELGEPPIELQVRAPGATLADHERQHAAALARLGDRGLGDPSGPSPRLAAALRLLAGAPLTLDLRLSNGLVALGASAGEHGVVVVRRGADLMLRTLDGSGVAAALVELVGPLRPGRVRSVDIAGELLDEARRRTRDGSYRTLANRLAELGVARADGVALARMCTDITGSGQLGATARTPGGERRGRWVIGFHRTVAGDFLQLRRPTGTGRARVTIAPITAAALLARLHELVDDLPAGRAQSAWEGAEQWPSGSRLPASRPAALSPSLVAPLPAPPRTTEPCRTGRG